MTVVRIKGLNRITKTTADGSRFTYWYAWKGGPRLPGKPGDPDFLAAYAAAVAERRGQPKDTLAGLVTRYKASPEFNGLSEATKAEWRRWLDKVAADVGPKDIGGLPLKALDDRRVRADLLEWRDQWADRPRTADYAIQVLHRVLWFGMDRGLLSINAAAGVTQLYESDRADQIWTAQELSSFQAKAPSPEVAFIPRLACLTGFRRTDLTRLAWSHVGDVAIVMPTGKSRGRKTQVIPLLADTKALLDEIRAQQARRWQENAAQAARKGRPLPVQPTTVLTNTRSRPWSPNGLEHMVVDIKHKAGVDKHLHDARGTFGTRLRKAGLTGSEIADILGWDEARVERLLKTYVNQDAIVLALAERIRKTEEGR